MKTLIKYILLLVIVVTAQSAAAEEIASFSARYDIARDGSVLVTETIIYNFGNLERHGIFRTLTTDHPQPASHWYTERSVDIALENVLVNKAPAPFTVDRTSDELSIKIGSPTETITGTHEYTIIYTLKGALSYGSAGAEFYWDVTGNAWEVPITAVVAEVSGAIEGILASTAECYVGSVGDTTRCAIGNDRENVRIFNAANLSAGEGLTIATELNATAVAVQIHEIVALPWLPYTIALLWLTGLSVFAVRFRRKYKKSQPVIAQYEPYAGVLPMYTGVLLDGRLDPHDITAGIVYLAEQGFFKIKKTEDTVLWVFNTTDYELTWLRADVASLPPMLQAISFLLFANPQIGDTVRISSLTQKRGRNSKIITSLQRGITVQLENDGYISKFVDLKFWSWPFIAGAVITAAVTIFVNVFVFVLVSIASVFIMVYACYKRPTAKGYEARNHLQGFALFLSVTDADRFAFHNAPEKSPELFMQYLPYAIALKVEKKWAEVFAGITIPNPTWYEGGNLGSFSAVALTNDLGAFSSSFTASSGTSGSSGGGSSGGGGGGGGGGSW